VFARAEELFSGQAQAKGIRLQFAALPFRNHQQVKTDQRMLESVLENLNSNAVKHTELGAVYVGTRLRTSFPTGQQLCIEVRDSGVGIAAELVPLVFDAYRSFDDRKSSESHGLGLAIARAQASYLGCEITVVSKPGHGSTFTLCGLRFKT
jgi:signal transduction histidine kinase